MKLQEVACIIGNFNNSCVAACKAHVKLAARYVRQAALRQNDDSSEASCHVAMLSNHCEKSWLLYAVLLPLRDCIRSCIVAHI